MKADHNQNIIEVKDVSFAYNDHSAIKDINLKIHKGDYLGIVGPNGGGKTTLLKVILGQLKPNQGTVKIFGVPIAGFQNWSKIGYVPQKAAYFDSTLPATVREIV